MEFRSGYRSTDYNFIIFGFTFSDKASKTKQFFTRLQTKASFNKNCLCSNLMWKKYRNQILSDPMEFTKFIFPLHLLLLLNGLVCGQRQPRVEIVEYFGSLVVKIGQLRLQHLKTLKVKIIFRKTSGNQVHGGESCFRRSVHVEDRRRSDQEWKR